jgi:hypothetical protein
MSATETVCLWRYQGARARWAARSWAGWPWRAYDGQAQADQPERHQASDRAFSAGAGLADADQVAGVKERLLR